MRYLKITKFDTANGPGIRTVFWVPGCPHHCLGCHNEETWNPDQGYTFTHDTLDEILSSIAPDHISGITFSGGDPLYEENLITIKYIIYTLKNRYPRKSIWLYTGYTWEEIHEMLQDIYNPYYSPLSYIIENCDVLVDGKFELDKKDMTLPYCGSTNQRVIDVKKTLDNNKIVLYE